MTIGAILKKTNIAKDSWVPILNNFALYVAFPALIIKSFNSVSEKLYFSDFVLTSSIIFLSSIFLLLLLSLTKLPKKIKNTYFLCSIVGNIAYIGFPFISAILPGQEGKLSMVVASFLFILYTFVIFILEKNSESKKFNFLNMLKNPLLLAVIFGIITLKISLPDIFLQTVNILAGAATPSALVAIGIFLMKKISFNKEFYHALSLSFVKLIIVPTFFIFLNKFISLDPIILIELSMPVALTPFALSEKYNLDKDIILYSIIISTIVSLVTLPLITSFII